MVSDPRHAMAQVVSGRPSRRLRIGGWLVGVAVWALASDGRVLVAALSVVAALVIRGFFVIVLRGGQSFGVFWSAWFFAVAAACELAWFAARSVS